MRDAKYALLGSLILLICTTLSIGAERKEFIATLSNGVQRVDVLAGSYFFAPNYIIVKVNVPLEMKIRKEGLIPHNFVIHAVDAGMDVKSDLGTDQIVITFTPTKPGVYPFYCDKKTIFMSSHKEKGMEGTLEVRE